MLHFPQLVQHVNPVIAHPDPAAQARQAGLPQQTPAQLAAGLGQHHPVAAPPQGQAGLEAGWTGVDSLAEEIEAMGRKAIGVEGDVTKKADVEAIVAAAKEKFEESRTTGRAVGRERRKNAL